MTIHHLFLKPILFLTALLAFLSGQNDQEFLKTVKTGQGIVSGTRLPSGVYSFKGIPFAAPPVGPLRWRDPQPARSWGGVLKCDRFGASAIQGTPLPNPPWTAEFMPPLAPISEDCLYLNVWTDAKHRREKLPVIVWIHGGSFTGGSGSVAVYDGEAMARKGIIFVTINYRVGMFGFLAHPALSAESPHHVSGNYGLLDQVAALQWVRDNIAAFGGDPANVTIDGQSAGSCCVNALVASPLAKGLFKRAIAESGFFFEPNVLRTLSQAEQEGLQTMNAKGAQTASEMRALPAGELVKNDPMRLPVVDGYALPGQVDQIFKQGKQNAADLLIGYNEGDEFVDDYQTAKAFKADAIRRYGGKAADFLKTYPAETNKEAEVAQRHLSRDQTFAFQAYTWAGLQTFSGKNKAWYYYFERIPPGKPDFGAFHSAEIPYALHNLRLWDKPFTNTDEQLSEMMSDYWVNFAKTGNPNGNGLPPWPAFDPKQTQVMQFGDTTQKMPLIVLPIFSFFDSGKTIIPVK